MKTRISNCTSLQNFSVIFLYIILIISISCAYSSTAQQLNPPIQNYSSIEYNAASQNWDISIDESGVIYVANNRGLLIFNGQTWKLFSLNSGAIIRSVYTYEDKIFTGSYREFGYWQRNGFGSFSYHSLKSLFKNIKLSDEEFWGIIAYKGDIYFRSFGGLYKYDGKSISKIASGVFTTMHYYKDLLLVAKGRDGLFFLNDNGKLEFFEPSDKIAGNTIADVIIHDDKLFVGTREKVYVLNEKEDTFELLPEKINKFINKHELNKLISLPNNILMFGTLKNGILEWNRNSDEYRVFDRSNGLQNNTILSMDYFKGNLWLGLDNGIDRVSVDSPINFYTNVSGELGAVYDLIKEPNDIFLASNTGVYQLKDNILQLITGADGHSWNLTRTDDFLISNSNSGTLKIQRNKAEIIDNSTGSFYTKLSPSNEIFIGTYTGIIKRTKDTFTQLDNINFPVRKIIFENENTMWAAHPYEGVYRIELSDSLDRAISVKEISSFGNKENFNPKIYKINNHIAVFSDEKWFKYNTFSDSLEVFEELSKLNGYK